MASVCVCVKVHITQGDQVGKAVIVSWVTMEEPGWSVVRYWREDDFSHRKLAKGRFKTYRYYNYTSGFIHHCTLRNLEVLTFTSNYCSFSKKKKEKFD